jgi:glycosyltransferase involved in cell wall biosynthesis
MDSRSNGRTVVSIFRLKPKKVGGIEAFAQELSRQLGDRGWRSVLCFDSMPSDNVARYLDQPNTILETVQEPFYLWLVRLLYRHRPAILHLNFARLFGVYALLARLLGVRQIYLTDHDSREPGFVAAKRPAWKRLVFRLVMAPLTGVICVSRYVQDCLTGMQMLGPTLTTVIYNGVDIARMEKGANTGARFRQAHGLPADAFLVAQVGQLSPDKGVADLIEAVGVAAAADSRVRLLLIGEGTHSTEYRRLVQSRGLADRVTFAGFLEDPVGDGAFAAADLVCAVSRWGEAFGLVVAEGMAAGRPLLATQVGALPELVSDGVTGFIVAPGDTAAMAERILRLAGDPELCRRLGRSGRDACGERFDLKRNVAQLLSYYGLEHDVEPGGSRGGQRTTAT